MTMKIPGAETIEKVIAGLPTNAVLSQANRELKRKLALAEKKIAKLEAEVTSLRPASGVPAEAVKVLKQYFETGSELTAHQIADIIEMPLGRVIHHIGTLRQSRFVQQSLARRDNSEPPHRITPKGSAFLVEQGIA